MAATVDVGGLSGHLRCQCHAEPGWYACSLQLCLRKCLCTAPGVHAAGFSDSSPAPCSSAGTAPQWLVWSQLWAADVLALPLFLQSPWLAQCLPTGFDWVSSRLFYSSWQNRENRFQRNRRRTEVPKKRNIHYCLQNATNQNKTTMLRAMIVT